MSECCGCDGRQAPCDVAAVDSCWWGGDAVEWLQNELGEVARLIGEADAPGLALDKLEEVMKEAQLRFGEAQP